MTSPPSILSVDPGSRIAAVALHAPLYRVDGSWDARYALVLFGRVVRPDNAKVRAVLQAAIELAPHPVRLAIEDQYIGTKLRGDSRRTLVLSSNRWVVLAEDHHVAVEWVNPQSWASRVLGLARVKREVKKRITVGAVAGHYGIDVGEDEADAVCIGRHVVQQLERELGGFIAIETGGDVQGRVW